MHKGTLLRSIVLVVFIFMILMFLLSGCAFGLDCSYNGKDELYRPGQLERNTFRDLARDQACIWTSPVRLKQNQNWTLFVPWASGTAALIGTDHAVMSDFRPTQSQINRAGHISDAGAFGLIGASALIYGVGFASNNAHARETGWLAGEAVVDGMVVNLAIQSITNRRRPDSPVNPGAWFESGAAFPSDHAMASWAVARVISKEYPGWLTRVAAYGTALSVSATRVLAEKHSPSDVFVGSTIGFLIGDYVYKSHHLTPFNSSDSGLSIWKPRSARSPYLPLDSVYYDMFDRLIAMGYIDSAIMGLRPWTRMECARLVAEAEQNVTPRNSAAAELLRLLKAEFGVDPDVLPTPRQPIESLYARVTGISGTPLRDSYHFGQTLVNDFGRPYGAGLNAYLGASGAASFGRRVTLYARGEYQGANGTPAYSPTTAAILRQIDSVPAPLLPHTADWSQFRLIEGYASLPFSNINISVGKQALQWGIPPEGGLLFSNNAEPLYMLRISQISPIRLPSFLGLLSFDGYFGKLAGHEFPRAPYTHGLKLTLKPTKNLELGFARTVVFAGDGHPLTFRSFWRSFSSVGDSSVALPGSPADVGDRRGGFELSYKLPKLRDWITLYADMMTDDDPSPLAAPQRSIINPGLYITRMPFSKKLDLRVEAPTSAMSAISFTHGRFFYFNNAYLDGYTNKSQILGNWVGRESKAVEATSNYWFTAQNVLQFDYRHSTIDPAFITKGGNNSDGRISYRRLFSHDLTASGSMQLERWNVPLLKQGAQIDTTVSMQLIWNPR